jgi:hypothetical protein
MIELDVGMGGKVRRYYISGIPGNVAAEPHLAVAVARQLRARGFAAADYFIPDERFNAKHSPSPEAVAKAYAELV